ncbi:MAG TPA: ATP-binding cassette domain-containing protein [Thermomicrobiales bacterium]|nr:ATP-binding cassette domain-containing protein [Thermomicrobiales bacterium]
MSNEPAVQVSGLEKSYGTTKVLAGIDLVVEQGAIFALLGPNGAGKTTTVRILATLLRPDAGRVRVAGFDVDVDQAQVRRRISLTGQYAAVDDLQTGEENVWMAGRLSGLSRSEARMRTRQLLERFDLLDAADKSVATYSGGMRRRLDLAASLVGHPSVIFLDEPTTGLDPRSRQAMWNEITALAGSGVTVFLTTQYLEEADHLAQRVAVIDGGRVVAEGTPAELKRRIGGARLDLRVTDLVAFRDVISALGDRVVRRDPSLLMIGVVTDGHATQVREILDEIDPARRVIDQFSVHTATLDDVFLTLTGRKASKPEQEVVHV